MVEIVATTDLTKYRNPQFNLSFFLKTNLAFHEKIEEYIEISILEIVVFEVSVMMEVAAK